MLYDLIRNQTPEYLNTYILDFASGTFKFFDKAPQIGDVLLSSDSEKINNLFKFLKEEIENRKKLFAPYGGDIKNYNKNNTKKVPNILVMIHNFAAFSEMYEMFNDDKIVSPEEREQINFQVSLIGKMIEAREKKGLSQRDLAKLSGVKQPAIARLESMKSTPQIDTLLKILAPLGYTLSITPIENKQ